MARSGGGTEGGVPALVRRDAFRRGRPSRVGGGVRGDAKESGGGSRAESGGGSRAESGGGSRAAQAESRARTSRRGRRRRRLRQRPDRGASADPRARGTRGIAERSRTRGGRGGARARARTRRRRPRRRRPRRSTDSAPRVPSASPWRRPGTPMVTGIRTVTHTGTSLWRCWRYQPRGVARNRPFVPRRGAETPETFSRRRVRRDRRRRTNPRTGGRTNGAGHATRVAGARSLARPPVNT